jgi:osmotically-inducible protein OsmY
MFLPACSPFGFFSSSLGSLDTASQERGLGGFVTDAEIRTRYFFWLFEKDHRLYMKVKACCYEGRLLLMGRVPTEEMRDEAVSLAWQVPGVKAVINEISVGEDYGAGRKIQDSLVETRLETMLFFKGNISSRNYQVYVYNGIVYLTGIALNREELDTVINMARGVGGVDKVVSYVRILTKYEEQRRKTFSAKVETPLDRERKERQYKMDPGKRVRERIQKEEQ